MNNARGNLIAHLKNLSRIEDRRASGSGFGEADLTIEKSVHETQVERWDTRRALALSSLHREAAPLSYVRSLLQHGWFDTAREEIEALKRMPIGQDVAFLDELKFEEVRLAFFESDWAGVIRLSDEILAAGTQPVARLALFQLRAASLFEWGEFGLASRAVEEAEILGHVFPDAVSLRYALAMKVRILARDQGLAAANRLLKRIVTEYLARGKADLDLVLTFLRSRIDLKRLGSEDFASDSLACFHLAERIGDKLYVALAELDLLSARCRSWAELRARAEPVARPFTRVKRILAELDEMGKSGTVKPSTSAVALYEAIGRSVNALSPGEAVFEDCGLLISEWSLFVHIPSAVVHVLPAESQLARAVSALDGPPLPKPDFFRRLWRLNYSPLRDDTHISSLLHRLRKELGLACSISDGQITPGMRVISL